MAKWYGNGVLLYPPICHRTWYHNNYSWVNWLWWRDLFHWYTAALYTGVIVAGEDTDYLQWEGEGSWCLCTRSLWLRQHSCGDGIAACQETVWRFHTTAAITFILCLTCQCSVLLCFKLGHPKVCLGKLYGYCWSGYLIIYTHHNVYKYMHYDIQATIEWTLEVNHIIYWWLTLMFGFGRD